MNARSKARAEILTAVNGKRVRHDAYRMRHIQLAVCIARRRRLVKDRVLIAAGFNPSWSTS